MRNAAVDAAGTEVEKFAAPAGRWFGWVVVALSGAVAVFAAAGDPGRDRKAIYVVVCICLVCWVVLIRPVVSLHTHGILLRNMVRDTFVPWSKIERCRCLQTLQVVTDEARFHGLGVSRSARSMAKQKYGRVSMTFRAPALTNLGFGGTPAASGSSGASAPSSPPKPSAGIAYQDYVETRVRDLARDAKPDDLVPVVSVVWQSVVALGVAVGLFVLLFV